MSIWTPDLAGLDDLPRYLALATSIGLSIDRGELHAGDRLPARRDLAFRLGLSIHTISSAYSEAERRGHVVGEVGRGTFVLGRPAESRESRYIMQRNQQDVIDLSICRPVQGDFTNARLRAVLTSLGADPDMSAMTACRPVVGLDSHRESAAQWLGGMGLRADPAGIIVTNGCAHAVQVALSALTEPGDAVATESLTDHGIISLASILHFRLVGIATDEHGMIPDALEAACRSGDIKVVTITPTLTNPTTTLMPEERRRKIVAIAERYDIWIVEDDVFGPLVEQGPPSLHSLAPNRTLYITGFTKWSVSGLRTGFLLAPEALVPKLVARVRATSWMATPLVAEIASRWIQDGTMGEIAHWQRERLRERNAIVARKLPADAIRGHPAAPNVWVRLPEPWRARTFTAQAWHEGVAITPSEPFVVGRSDQPHAVRLSIGAAESIDDLERGLDVIAALLSQEPDPMVLTV